MPDFDRNTARIHPCGPHNSKKYQRARPKVKSSSPSAGGHCRRVARKRETNSQAKTTSGWERMYCSNLGKTRGYSQRLQRLPLWSLLICCVSGARGCEGGKLLPLAHLHGLKPVAEARDRRDSGIIGTSESFHWEHRDNHRQPTWKMAARGILHDGFSNVGGQLRDQGSK